MIGPTNEGEPPAAPSQKSLVPQAQANGKSAKTLHEVLVPCFIKVSVMADDELQAEVLAQNNVRRLGKFHVPAHFGVQEMAFHALLGPIITTS